MSSTPFIQLYVGDYLADTLDLTTEQHGAYLLILMTMWQHDGKLPNDPVKLARISRMTTTKFRPVWGEISRFFLVEDDKITNPRLTKERKKAAEKSTKRAAAGRAGGQAKALKDNEARLANAMPLPQHSSDTRVQKEEEDTNVSMSGAAHRPLDDISKAVHDYNDAAQRAKWPVVTKLTDARRRALRSRLRDCGGNDGWKAAISRAEASDFLCGRSANPWTGFGFDWIAKPTNFTKLIEGNYDNRSQPPQHNRKTSASDALRYQLDVVGRTRPSPQTGIF